MKQTISTVKPLKTGLMKNDLKIIFFGTPDFVIPVLNLLIETGHNISAIFTGNGTVEVIFRKQKIKIFQPKTLKEDGEIFQEFKNLKPDICIVAAYGKILPQKYLNVPRFGFLNIHPSLLPKYRGPSPIQTAILNGDKETGVTIMKIDDQVDHGPTLAEEKYLIDKNKDLITISKELFELGAKLLIKILPEYIDGKIKPREQDHDQATFTKMFKRVDGRINWGESSEKIYNRIGALNPNPGTWTTWKDKVINISTLTTLDVVNPQMINLEPEMSGMVKKLNNDIVIKTGTGYLIIRSLQLESGKKMDVQSFINGHPDFLGSILE